MQQRLISICIIGILICGIYTYAQIAKVPTAKPVVALETAEEEFPGNESININANALSDDDKREVQEEVESIQDMPEIKISSGRYLTANIQSQEEYEGFISRLEEFTDCDSLSMDLGETDTTIYLDEILAHQNFERLYIGNGGTISFKNTQILTYPIRSIQLSHVYAIEESLLGNIISGDSYVQYALRIELDNRYLGTLPIEELLDYENCSDVILVWNDNTDGKGLLDVQENMENLKEWDYLQSVWEVTDGCLKGIYRLNDEDYSYTSYEFYNHCEESWLELCAAFICVKDRESDGEEYFDIIDIPTDKFTDKYLLRRGISVNRLTRWSDLNFDGYKDLVFDSTNYDSFSLGGNIIFLWDEEEQRFKLCESAPEYYDHVDAEKERLTRSSVSSLEDDYYIYEYKDNVFTEKHFEIKSEDIYGKHVIGQYFYNGELIAQLELMKEEDGSRHFFYEEIGGTREKVQVEDGLSFYSVSELFFPEFDFWKFG